MYDTIIVYIILTLYIIKYLLEGKLYDVYKFEFNTSSCHDTAPTLELK